MPLLDASGPFTLAPTWTAAFPEALAADWAEARSLDSEAFGPDGVWLLSFRCFAVRRPGGRVVLVDTGIGHASGPARWAPVPGRLPQRLADAGIDVDDVDIVVLTHLHSDHVGWSIDSDGELMFRNARYVLQRNEIRALVDAGDEMLISYVVEPLRRAGQLHEVDGRVQLAGNRISHGPTPSTGAKITVVPTPGHTPGHQSVIVEGERMDIAITGDVVVHAVQLADPSVGYIFEDDQELARRTRYALLSRARHKRILLATAHLTPPFVEIP